MKRITALFLLLALCLPLAACGGGENTIWDAAAPNQSVLSLYYFDGESGWRGWISDLEIEKSILKDLSSVNAKPVENWSPDKLSSPIYGIEIGTADGMGILTSWSGGYLILRDGSVYKFDYDFAALTDSYAWGNKYEVNSVSGMPCGRYLSQDGDEWIAANLEAADEHTRPENISIEIISNEDSAITVALGNTGSEEWLYGNYFSVEVFLDGAWYRVPAMPTNNWAFTDIAHILPPGRTQNKTCSLEMYGGLPAGSYRLVMEELCVEFEL